MDSALNTRLSQSDMTFSLMLSLVTTRITANLEGSQTRMNHLHADIARLTFAALEILQCKTVTNVADAEQTYHKMINE